MPQEKRRVPNDHQSNHQSFTQSCPEPRHTVGTRTQTSNAPDSIGKGLFFFGTLVPPHCYQHMVTRPRTQASARRVSLFTDSEERDNSAKVELGAADRRKSFCIDFYMMESYYVHENFRLLYEMKYLFEVMNL